MSPVHPLGQPDSLNAKDPHPYVIAFAAIAISGYYILSWYMRKKFLKADKEIEKMPIIEEMNP
jgi:hypothetical protein